MRDLTDRSYTWQHTDIGCFPGISGATYQFAVSATDQVSNRHFVALRTIVMATTESENHIQGQFRSPITHLQWLLPDTTSLLHTGNATHAENEIFRIRGVHAINNKQSCFPRQMRKAERNPCDQSHIVGN